MYEGQIIHFFGGMTPYIGELHQNKKHPNGDGWIRINNPCQLHVEKQGKNVRAQVRRIWGMNKIYQKFVDIYCPPDSLKEIMVLDKDGDLYKSYKKEIERPDTSSIHLATDSDIADLAKHQNQN